MAYCAAADIKKFFLNWASPITDADLLAEWVAKADALIDATLRPHYAVPITNATDLILLESVSSHLSAQYVYDALYSEVRDSADNPDLPMEGMQRRWEKRAMDVLDALREGRMSLVTARASSQDAGVSEDYENVETNEPAPSFRIAEVW